jgi:hypothetical protein
MSEIVRPKMISKAAGTEKEPKTVGEAAVELLTTAKESLQLMAITKSTNAMLNPPQEGGGAKAAAESTEAANKQLMTVFTGLTGTLTSMVELERNARIAAERSSSENMQNYFKLIADQAKELTDRMKEMQPPEPVTIADKLTEMKALQDIVSEHAEGIAKRIVASTQPALSRTGLSSVDVDLKKLELNQNVQLLQMQQNHEIAIKTMEIEIKKLGMEAARWEVGQQNKQNWFTEAIGAFGQAFQQGIGNQPLGGGVQQETASPVHAPPQVGKTPAGLIAVKCSTPGCEIPFAVVPGMESVACPKCGTVYQTSDLQPADAAEE